jgi:hypothetical protein
MTKPWTQTSADVNAYNYGDMADSFLTTVMRPAMHALVLRRSSLSRSEDEAIAAFAVHDHDQLMTHANMSFCLAISALWEHQLREYLIDTVRQSRLQTPSEESIQGAKWDRLVKLFQDVKGIALKSFDSFDRLDTLQLLGNTCRHGDGKSARALFAKCPELWPDTLKTFWSGTAGPVFFMHIPDAFIADLVDAIVLFWIDMRILSYEYLSTQGLELDTQLAQLRADRIARL